MIKMNDEMRMLKGEGWSVSFNVFVIGFKPTEISYPDIDAGVLSVIIEYYGDNYISWLEEPIETLNNYTPHQLLKTKIGTRIIKGFLMRMP